MPLRTQAEQDLGTILEGDAHGFRWPVVIVSPTGQTVGDPNPFYGFSDDISAVIDPETGVLVSGRLASVALRISALQAAGLATLPEAVADQAGKPWLVRFNDINGSAHAFKVRQSLPDRALGLLVCILEGYDE